MFIDEWDGALTNDVGVDWEVSIWTELELGELSSVLAMLVASQFLEP